MKAFEDLKQAIIDFIDQGEVFIFFLKCKDVDVPVVLKLIDQIDQSSGMDVFLPFVHNVRAQAPNRLGNQYLDEICVSLKTALRAHHLDDKLPPAALAHVSQAIPAIFDHIASLLPKGDHRVLWAFLPFEIEDEIAWARFIAYLDPKPQHRVIVRATDTIMENLKEPHRGFIVDIDLFKAHQEEVKQRALDPATPPKQRHLDLFQFAGLDFAGKRYIDAIKKYGMVYKFFEGQPDGISIQAMCLLGVGDVARQVVNFRIAKERYQQALALVAKEPDMLPITMIACGNLGDVCTMRKELEEALQYYGMASDIAGKLCHLETKCDIMEKIGDVQERLGKNPQPIWVNALAIALDGNYEERVESLKKKIK